MKKYESIRIFKNPVLESMTHVHPIIPLLLWTPFVIFLIYRSYFALGYTHLEMIICAISGLLIWTLTEYLLHRFVFHLKPIGPLTKRFVFLFHGLHHDDPNDPTRLVMPPVPAILIMALIWGFFSLFIPAYYLSGFMAFFTVGYLCYDYIHYATHHFKMTGRVGRYLKKFHLQHHFRHEKAKYGVSSPLWDYVFRTVTGEKEEGY
ncbi:sterol desaturase family protein [Halobacteriovorax sp.]|uniref:sterol desaturase family protein n=1 Tax=Halobacteriovorax sp. TaxID=2020862 RepID=UPI003AF310F9